LHELLIDPKFKERFGQCVDGTSFNQGLIGPQGDRSLVFATASMLNVMVASLWLFMDGTFSARPSNPPTRQFFVILALHQSVVSHNRGSFDILRIEFFFLYLSR
jgi:hypothetical protein